MEHIISIMWIHYREDSFYIENIFWSFRFELATSQPDCSNEEQQQSLKSQFNLWRLELILGLGPSNDRCCYKVTPSLIGWVQT